MKSHSEIAYEQAKQLSRKKLKGFKEKQFFYHHTKRTVFYSDHEELEIVYMNSSPTAPKESKNPPRKPK